MAKKPESKPTAKREKKSEVETEAPAERLQDVTLTPEAAEAAPDLGGANVNEEAEAHAIQAEATPRRSIVSELPSARKKAKGKGKKDDDDDLDVSDKSTFDKGLDLVSQSMTPVDTFHHIPTGAVALDKVMKGGWPRPMIVESYSEEGVAKTTIALMTCKMTTLSLCEHAIFLDYEHGVQMAYLDQLGIPYANLTVTDEDLDKRLGKAWVELEPQRIMDERATIRRERIVNALKSKKALLWIFSPVSFEEGWDIMRTLQGSRDEDGDHVPGILQRPAAYICIDSYAAMRPSMFIKFGGRPMQQGMMGSEFLSKIIHHLMVWNSTLHILNHLRLDVQRMMWDKHRPSYLPPPKASFSSNVLKFLAHLRTNMKRTEKVEIETMDSTRGEKTKVTVGHYVICTQEKQKSHAPMPCQFLVMYGHGVDNVDLLILLGCRHKLIKLSGKTFILGDWAPLVPDKKGKMVTGEFNTRRDLRAHLVKTPDTLRLLVTKIGELEYLPTKSLLEIHPDYDPETETLKAPRDHILFHARGGK